ncbi:polysaccharide deacetylase family protein [Taibaiella chishuiensis]|uniref:DUF7033 domain-containing protein n=1 Tax=Taibaiella chishuiensis TaxID=1434707 RepID=A0A2P8DAG2_9BACT|nr:polysaccharide deacetylase family protein [Taibaiella chishuiensis]PSK94161.1 hypothetical protein B0I18_101312 [Taibaiella chishuiensis]
MTPTLLIYSGFDTPRLRYVLDWICHDQLQTGYRLTGDAVEWRQYSGPKLSYSGEQPEPGALRIKPVALLQEDGIKVQQLNINRWKHSTILFYNQPGAPVPFDLFAAVFYLLSRYEEYLPYQPDRHGRYPASLSVAGQYAFLQQPVVDEWICSLRKLLEQQCGIALPHRQGACRFSYDIDIAWKFLHKGARRTWGGYLRDLLRLQLPALRERKRVLSGQARDPYDCFAWLDSLHRQYKVQPLYFLLLGKGSAYDKNADPELPAMKKLVAGLGAQYDTGIHPSYASHQSEAVLQEEIGTLARNGGQAVSRSRQHYIKFSLPHTYRNLLRAGITDDYSMGYASVNGFRAGTANAFAWYDLEADAVTTLQVHPFAFMDATSKFYARNNTEETFLEFERLYLAVKKTGGTFFSIWHNYILGTDAAFAGWPALYERVLQYTAS